VGVVNEVDGVGRGIGEVEHEVVAAVFLERPVQLAGHGDGADRRAPARQVAHGLEVVLVDLRVEIAGLQDAGDLGEPRPLEQQGPEHVAFGRVVVRRDAVDAGRRLARAA
jgi:hypothetical protein